MVIDFKSVVRIRRNRTCQKLVLSENTNEGAFSSRHCDILWCLTSFILLTNRKFVCLLVATSVDVQ